MTRDLRSQLKALKHDTVNPRAEWVQGNRAQLLSQIKNTVPAEPASFWHNVESAVSLFATRKLAYAIMRPVAFVLVMAITLTSAYTGTVKASYEALPGDTLYPAKRLVENIPVTMASLVGDTSTETKLRSENAKQRAVEVTKLLQSDDPAKIDKASQTVNDLKNEIVTINAKLEASTSTGTSMPADTVAAVKNNTDEIKNVLSDVKTDLITSATSTVVPLAQEVSDAKNLVKDVSVKAVEVIVAKHLEGDASVTKDAVTAMVSSTLQSVVSDANQSKQSVDTTKDMVHAVQIEVKDLSADARKQSDSALASTTKQFSDQLNSVSSLTQAAADQTQAVSNAVDKRVSEAHASLGSGDLLQAVNAIKQVNTVSKEVEKISDAALQSTQNVLPIVQVIKDAVSSPSSSVQFSTTSAPVVVPTTSLINLKNVLSAATGSPIMPDFTTSSMTNTPKFGVASSTATTTDDKRKQ